MKSFSRFAVALFALLVPALASAQGQYKLVYRPELRTVVLVPNRTESAPPVSEPRADMIARHKAMAAAYRLNPSSRTLASPADHCDRLVAALTHAETPER
jgi:hypothetical protein